MHKFLILLFFLLLSIASSAQSVEKAVLFGEHAIQVPTETSNSLKIFMDMNGDYYPEEYISDYDLRKEGNSQLKIWASRFPDKFIKIAKGYDLGFTTYSAANYQILQDAIIQNNSSIINLNAKNKRLVWLIHGFRKELYNADGISRPSSYLDNQAIKYTIGNALDQAQIDSNFYIELYWDGKYADFGFKVKNLIELGRLFKKEALPNARQIGYSLRKLFSFITNDELVIISHSAGTHIATALLFNTQKEFSLPTPDHASIRVALLASASPGKKLFSNFYLRNTERPFQDNDNYSFINVYKENDIVLRKKGFVGLYGNTALGCNFRNASGKLKKLFEKRYPNSIYEDCAIKGDYSSHQFTAYARSKNFSKAIDFLFQ